MLSIIVIRPLFIFLLFHFSRVNTRYTRYTAAAINLFSFDWILSSYWVLLLAVWFVSHRDSVSYFSSYAWGLYNVIFSNVLELDHQSPIVPHNPNSLLVSTLLVTSECYGWRQLTQLLYCEKNCIFVCFSNTYNLLIVIDWYCKTVGEIRLLVIDISDQAPRARVPSSNDDPSHARLSAVSANLPFPFLSLSFHPSFTVSFVVRGLAARRQRWNERIERRMNKSYSNRSFIIRLDVGRPLSVPRLTCPTDLSHRPTATKPTAIHKRTASRMRPTVTCPPCGHVGPIVWPSVDE